MRIQIFVSTSDLKFMLNMVYDNKLRFTQSAAKGVVKAEIYFEIRQTTRAMLEKSSRSFREPNFGYQWGLLSSTVGYS